jgi:LysM repeat protein
MHLGAELRGFFVAARRLLCSGGRTGPLGPARGEMEIAPMLRIRIAVCATIFVACSAHAAIDNAGTTAGNFLSVGTGAGILSMGGATLGAGQDLNAAAWNPAALGRLAGSQFALSHASLATESTQEWLAAGGRVGAARTRWGASALYQGDGSFDGRDAFGASTGSFNVSSMAFGVQLAQPLGEAFTAGLGAHWLSDNLGDASGHGLGFDAGVQATAGAFGLGAAVRNVGGSMQYDGGRFDLPAVYGVGASWSHPASGVRLALDANFPHAYYNDVRVGGEWRWQDRVALRAGYRLELGAAAGEPLGGPSFGLGAGADGVWMDYAFLATGAQEQGQHRLGMTFRPGFLNRALRPTADANAPAPAAGPVAVAAPPARSENAAPAPAAPAIPVPVAGPPVAASRPAVSAAPVAAPEPAAPVAEAQSELPPAGALHTEVAPRPLAKSRNTNVRVSRPVRVTPLVMPTPAENAALAAELAPKPVPAVAAPRPAPANAAPVAPAPVAVAAVPTPAPVAPAPVAVAPAPVAVAPAPAPAPIAQVASSAPRITVVTRPAAPSAPVVEAPVTRPATVTVRKGETMADIARQWHTSVAAIMMQNNLVREQVSPGQKLKMPQP